MFIVAVVRYGAVAFDAARYAALQWGSAEGSAGATLAAAVTALEARLLAGQHAMCLRDTGAGGCARCCDANFAQMGHTACLASCEAAAHTTAAAESGVFATLARNAWGACLLAMLGYFVVSIIDASVAERWAAMSAAEAGAAPSATPSSSSGENEAPTAGAMPATPPASRARRQLHAARSAPELLFHVATPTHVAVTPSSSSLQHHGIHAADLISALSHRSQLLADRRLSVTTSVAGTSPADCQKS